MPSIMSSIKKGDTVRVRKWSHKYGGKYAGRVGTVDKVPLVCEGYLPGQIGVTFEGEWNNRSSWGGFWFHVNELEIEKEEPNMFMSENFTVAAVSFLDGTNTSSEYFYALFDQTAKPGDLVVVKTGHHGLALARIKSIHGDGQDRVKHGREVVCVADTSGYDARTVRRVKMAELKQKMDARVAELQDSALYEMLSAKDPALKSMLDEYLAIRG